MTFCGVPIFFQEVAMGQYLGSGGMTLVSQLCPILKGVGIATFSQLPDLPWDTYDGWWNTDFCFRPSDNMTANDILLADYPMHNVAKKGITSLVRKTTTPVEEYWE